MTGSSQDAVLYSFDDLVWKIWLELLAGGLNSVHQTMVLVADKMNFNDDGTRVTDVDGNPAPWVDVNVIRDVITERQ